MTPPGGGTGEGGGGGAPPGGEPSIPDDVGEPIGPFPTWKALYTTVLVWWVVLIALLVLFTVVSDRAVAP